MYCNWKNTNYEQTQPSDKWSGTAKARTMLAASQVHFLSSINIYTYPYKYSLYIDQLCKFQILPAITTCIVSCYSVQNDLYWCFHSSQSAICPVGGKHFPYLDAQILILACVFTNNSNCRYMYVGYCQLLHVCECACMYVSFRWTVGGSCLCLCMLAMHEHCQSTPGCVGRQSIITCYVFILCSGADMSFSNDLL